MELRFRALMVNILLPAFRRKEWCQEKIDVYKRQVLEIASNVKIKIDKNSIFADASAASNQSK